jgi:hypothetical protein
MDAKSRKNMLIDIIIVNATSKKKKNGPGSRRRLAMTESRNIRSAAALFEMVDSNLQ